MSGRLFVLLVLSWARGGGAMGIQKFHQWIDRRFDASTPVHEAQTTDHLLIDMNSLIHGAARRASTPRDAIKRVLGKLDGLLDARRPGATVKARHTLALFVDGPAPLAKLVTQRERRLKGKRAARADGVEAKGTGGDKGGFEALHISPGTEFQRELSMALAAWATKRLAKDRGGPMRVIISDASVAGEGEVKCLEYLDSVLGADAVLFGGDADLVAMALCRVPTAGGRLRILDDNGRGIIDVAKFAAALVSDARRPAADVSAVAMDFMILAIISGGNDYLPAAASTAFDKLWSLYTAAAPGKPLWDAGMRRIDRTRLAALLAPLATESPAESSRRAARLVEDAARSIRTAGGAPGAPNTVAELPRKADAASVRLFPPKDFGAIASGAETLRYRVLWRPRGKGAWRAAVAPDGDSLADAPLERVADGARVWVEAGCGDVEFSVSARNGRGWGRMRAAALKRPPQFCVALCSKLTMCRDADCVHAHAESELAGPPPLEAALSALTLSDDDDAGDGAAEPAVAGAVAWDAAAWLDMLDWCVGMYVRGRCDDFRCAYTACAAPPLRELVDCCVATEPSPRPRPVVGDRPPLSAAACLASLLPGRSAAGLLPAALRSIMDDGSPVADLWWGGNTFISLDRLLAEIDARLGQAAQGGAPVSISLDARTREVASKALALRPDGRVAYDGAARTAARPGSRQAASRPAAQQAARAPPRAPPSARAPSAASAEKPPRTARAATERPPRAAQGADRAAANLPPRAAQGAAAADRAPRAPARQPRTAGMPRSVARCKFEATPGGCRRGADCQFQHG
ncbi:XRN 5'-3' exonuclease N-terminus-domain-containing protein [Pelagophyceae sp. CCMP2097]|nr:XRN 5'-3' exonuclease N-terminus-domain-containing protein [Pelagophyceae sp. CCMP2097]